MYKILFAVSLSIIVIMILIIGMHDSYANSRSKEQRKALEDELHSLNADSDRQAALRGILLQFQTHHPWLAIGPLRAVAAKPSLCGKVDKAMNAALRKGEISTADLLDRIAIELRCE